MYYSTPSVNVGGCTASITRNRNRAKIYGDSVYLKDGENFEIELFNPKTARVLAKIQINGNSISDSGIVLKPGERVYLERFIDSNNKFVFETYEVENSNVVMNAIRNNGLVEVFFYDEVTTSSYDFYPGSITINTGTGPYRSYSTYGITGNNGPSGIVGTYCSGTHDGFYYSGNSDSFGGSTVNNLFTTSNSVNTSVKSSLNNIETGRVEKGDSSNQIFETVNGSFRSIACSNISIKLLPESQKPIESSSIRNYCTNCGTRMKKQSWKFCPSCGTKI
jgi:hypothetical protein